MGEKTIFVFNFNRINGFVGVYNRKAEQPVLTWTANGANKKLVLHMRFRRVSQSITTPVSHLAKEFNVQSELQGQVSLAAFDQIFVLHEAMNGCKNLKIH